jgi:hypothetical protein
MYWTRKVRTLIRFTSLASTDGYNNLAADPIYIDLYITHLIDRHCSPDVISNAIYAIKWFEWY